jgi:anthranilate phosphoribosyltransferase
VSIASEFKRLFANEMSDEEAKELLVGLYERGESAEDIATVASIMRRYAIPVELSEDLRSRAVDIVGTGGDRSGSFNISTTVSLLLASMGCVIAKHGNRSITSNSGSTDLLEALGLKLDLTPKSKMTMLEEGGFCFFPATDHHPAMRHIMPIRRSLSHRTIFNILGPLTNPATVQKYLLGVFDPSYIKPIASALLHLDTKSAFVVSSHDGMDEISLAGRSSFAFVKEGQIIEGEINPEAFGFTLAPKEAILGGDAKENASITRAIFEGSEQGPKRDIVILNASFALLAEGRVRDITEAKEQIEAALDSKRVLTHLESLIALSQRLD